MRSRYASTAPAARHVASSLFFFVGRRLVEYISSGPVLAMELRAPSAVAAWRQTLGPTDPEKARLESPDTLRARFGTDTTYNAAHGSDSVQAAVRVRFSLSLSLRIH